MKYGINWFERWMLRRIAHRLTLQSPHHQSNITEYYSILTDEARKSFHEDSPVTLNHFLMECFEESLLPREVRKNNG